MKWGAVSRGLDFSLFMASVGLHTSDAQADDLLRRHSVVYRSLTAGRLNPLGLVTDLKVSYRYRLYQALPTILRESYLMISPTVALSPAFGRLGVMAEVQPLAILNLNAGIEFVGHFRSFDTIQTFPSVNVNFSDAAQDPPNPNVTRPPSHPGYTYDPQRTWGWAANFGATLQVRAGAIVARSINRLQYNQLTLAQGHESDRVFYDIFTDALVPVRGWVFTTDNDLLYSPEGEGLTIGARFSAVYVPYTSDELGGRENPTPTMRLGPVIAYNFYEVNHARFNAPTVYVAAQWWLAHPYRTGAPATIPGNALATDYISRGIPYVALGFSFRGDLLR